MVCSRHKKLQIKTNVKLDIMNYTEGQKKALLESLKAQSSPMTQGEKSLLAELKEYFTTIVSTIEGLKVERLGDKVRILEMDTFGEDYRNRWIKLRYTSKGEFFSCYYWGNKRMYLDNDLYMG